MNEAINPPSSSRTTSGRNGVSRRWEEGPGSPYCSWYEYTILAKDWEGEDPVVTILAVVQVSVQ